MEVHVRLSGGHVAVIPCVRYHPEYVVHEPCVGDVPWPAGCFVRKYDLKRYNDSFNAFVKRNMPDSRKGDRTLDELIGLIECAEMPFEILDDDSPEPWKNRGNVVKAVPFGATDLSDL